MKQFLSSILLCLIASGSVAAQGQAARDAADAQRLYAQANMGASSQPLRVALIQQPKGFLGDGTFQAGALRTFDGQRRPIPGLRYAQGNHVGGCQRNCVLTQQVLVRLHDEGRVVLFDHADAGVVRRGHQPNREARFQPAHDAGMP